ncbi:MAG: hypothetical protein C4527_28565 [Candidatus Omnitrophota bacterium]|jgi:hypothetical protein|nr:MAG: hypothetical protein C4527_28565 [Candidatus Omnitrophota bacterium]
MRYYDLIRSVVSGSSFWGRLLLTQISGILAWTAFPDVDAHSVLAWICFSFWFLSIHEAGWKERFAHGLMMGCWYSLPGKWGIFWQVCAGHFINYWVASLFFGLFIVSYMTPFVLFSLIPSILSGYLFSTTFF